MIRNAISIAGYKKIRGTRTGEKKVYRVFCKLKKMINIVGLAKGTDYKSAPAGVIDALNSGIKMPESKSTSIIQSDRTYRFNPYIIKE